MMSILLFHCCCNSDTDEVNMDICRYLSKHDQMLILKFCENLNDMEVTVNNIECAIKGVLLLYVLFIILNLIKL